MASGKLKFVKNKKAAKRTAKKATKARAKTTTTKRSKSSKSSKSGGNRTSKNGTTLPVGLLAPGGLGTYLTVKDTIRKWKESKSAKKTFRMLVLRTTGLDMDKKFGEPGFWLWQEAYFPLGWGIGKGLHWGIGKKMGVNQALGQARVPIFRV